MIHKTFKYQGLDIQYRAGTSDENVLSHSFDNDIFFKEIPEFRFSRDSVVVDVGAHIGTFSILSALKSRTSKVYAIEASKETHSILKLNIEQNQLPNVIPIHSALAGNSGIVKLYYNKENGNWGHSITKKLSNDFESMSSITLQSLCELYSLKFIDLIKFNCEGAEFEIIIESPERIIQKIGVGIILYHLDLTNKYTLDELKNKLIKNGFYYRSLHESNGRGWLVVFNQRKYTRFKRIKNKIITKVWR